MGLGGGVDEGSRMREPTDGAEGGGAKVPG